MVLAFPAGAGIETPGIPDGNPGIEAFLSFAMTSNITFTWGGGTGPQGDGLVNPPKSMLTCIHQGFIFH